VANRLTDAQLRNVRAQALRAVRRKQRTVDTKLEVMERMLDRAIENKERITINLMINIALKYKAWITQIRQMESAIADAIMLFQS
jgi:hypothetical protein